ncbi:MAG: N-6 DNA methylase [Promethearchaeota archaeon]
MNSIANHRRKYGQHFTSTHIFHELIFPRIKSHLNQYIWVDLFAGAGNLVLPILEYIPKSERVKFFQNHIFLCDIQQKCVEEIINNAKKYEIPEEIARNNIFLWDSLKSYPPKILEQERINSKPLFHITNPPYLYLGYIAKNSHTKSHLAYFQGKNKGYQDLYQIALMNDLRNSTDRMIYLIPTNFIFGNSVSNKIRDDFLPLYKIEHAYIYEKPIFDFTGMNVGIFFFKRKKSYNPEKSEFDAVKINTKKSQKHFILHPKYHYRAGTHFEEFVEKFKSHNPLKIHYYLQKSEVKKNSGNYSIKVIDANRFIGNSYEKTVIYVNKKMKQKILANQLWVRTVDTGTWEGRAGLYNINASFKVNGILVTKNTYRTNPIQIFFDTPISLKDQELLREYVNFILEYLRSESDSEFLTSYKYSSGDYIRKYFGLSQARKIIETCPLLLMNSDEKIRFDQYIKTENVEKVLKICGKYSYKGKKNE